MTADELLQLPEDGWKYELVQGELRKMSPTGEDHGYVAGKIMVSLGSFVYERNLGRVYIAEAGYRLARDPDTVRAPDVSFVRTERVRKSSRFIEGAPDVAFEVVSPTDSYDEIDQRTRDFLRAGTTAVVIVNPRTKSARVHRASGVTDVADVITIPDVLPGWQLPLSELFD